MTDLSGEIAGGGVDAFAGERCVSLANVDVTAIAQLVVGSVKGKGLHHVSAGAEELSVKLKNGLRMLNASFRRPRARLYVSMK